MRASRRWSLVLPILGTCAATGCGGTGADEGAESIPAAVRDYTSADATGDADRFCSILTARARASFADADGSTSCEETVEQRHDFVDGDEEGARFFRKFLEDLADAAADEGNLRIARAGAGAAQVRIKRKGERSFPVKLRREDGRWKVDEVAETATLR